MQYFQYTWPPGAMIYMQWQLTICIKLYIYATMITWFTGKEQYTCGLMWQIIYAQQLSYFINVAYSRGQIHVVMGRPMKFKSMSILVDIHILHYINYSQKLEIIFVDLNLPSLEYKFSCLLFHLNKGWFHDLEISPLTNKINS